MLVTWTILKTFHYPNRRCQISGTQNVSGDHIIGVEREGQVSRIVPILPSYTSGHPHI